MSEGVLGRNSDAIKKRQRRRLDRQRGDYDPYTDLIELAYRIGPGAMRPYQRTVATYGISEVIEVEVYNN